MEKNPKANQIPLPEADFLKGKVIFPSQQSQKRVSASNCLESSRAKVERKATGTGLSKLQSIVRKKKCPRRSGAESIEAWPSTGRSLKNISDPPLKRLRSSLNKHLVVLLGAADTVVCCSDRLATKCGGSEKRGGNERKWEATTSFPEL